MNEIDLGGHSGCKILLIESEDGSNFVRKISKDFDYNARLQAQCLKQADFRDETIKAPKVFRSGINENGLFFFDMEYVQGITLAEYLRTIEIGRVRGLVKSFSAKLRELPKGATNDANRIFAKKVLSLKKSLSGRDPVLDEALALLESHDWSAFAPSFCHGDMTLENIIVRDNELYFIDFLDSFYDSVLMDMGTLLQDIQAMWSYRDDEKTDMNLVLRLIVFRDLLIDEVRTIDESLVSELYFAFLQKLVRVIPYTTDEKTFRFLVEKIALVNKEIA